MLTVELRKMLRRPRTWVTLTLLAGLPVIVAIFVKVTDVLPRPGTGPPLLSAIQTNGRLLAPAALAMVIPLLLPVSVAVVAGDMIAGEAQQGTLRYLLVRPVGRTRLLWTKLVVVVLFILIAVVFVAGINYVVGLQLFGVNPVPTLSGPELTGPEATRRIIYTVLYVGWSMLGVASVALFLSTITDSPLAAALGALAVLVSSTLLLTIDAAAAVQPYLPTRYWLAFVDMFREPPLWRDIQRGVALQAVYMVVLLGASWANFQSKDITS
ncbi:MAG TPA: ABC transporter permease [Mycobacteriales bacterium]|nr:ABC transporter permease [Mycobacteriales bacterium]